MIYNPRTEHASLSGVPPLDMKAVEKARKKKQQKKKKSHQQRAAPNDPTGASQQPPKVSASGSIRAPSQVSRAALWEAGCSPLYDLILIHIAIVTIIACVALLSYGSH